MSSAAQQVVVFSLGSEEYALPISSFLEIRASVDDVSDRVSQIAAVMAPIAESSSRM